LPTIIDASSLIEALRPSRSAISYVLKVQLSFANINYKDSEIQEVITTINSPGSLPKDTLINVLTKLTSLPLVESARDLKTLNVLLYYTKPGGAING